MTKKRDKNRNLPAFEDLVNKRCEPFQGDPQVDFIFRHHVLKHTVKDSAAAVGISESYGYKINKDLRLKPQFRAKIMKKLAAYPEDYKNACKALLPTILDTEVKAIKKMQENPELAIKHPQLLKQAKQAAGIDFNEGPRAEQERVIIGDIHFVRNFVRGVIFQNDSSVEGEAFELPRLTNGTGTKTDN
jgi:hypothetical protein